MARLSKEQLDWAYANLKEENFSYLIRVAEKELKQILAEDNYLTEAESFFYNYRQNFVFAQALGRIIKTCDDPTYQKAVEVIRKVFREEQSLFIALIIAAAYPHVSPARKNGLKNLGGGINFELTFNAYAYIFTYNELFLANDAVGGAGFLVRMMQKIEAKIKVLIDNHCWALHDVEKTILFLDKMNRSYVNGLSAICQIAGDCYTSLDIKSCYAQILWTLGKRHSFDKKINESLANSALKIMVDAAAKETISSLIAAICYQNNDPEWQTKCFGACAQAFPWEFGKQTDYFNLTAVNNWHIDIGKVAEYLRDMYAQILTVDTEEAVERAIVNNLKNADFYDKDLPQIKSLILFAAKTITHWPNQDARFVLDSVLKLDWKEDEVLALKYFVGKAGEYVSVDELKRYWKYFNTGMAEPKDRLFRILVDKVTTKNEVSLEQYKNLEYYLGILYGVEEDALPTENLNKASALYKEELTGSAEFGEKLKEIMAIVGEE